MRILFDQGTPLGIRDSLSEHIVRTAREQGWSTLLNGELLRAAEDAGFDVLLTTDTEPPLPAESRRPEAGGRWTLIRQQLPGIVAAIESAKPGTWTVVEMGDAE